MEVKVVPIADDFDILAWRTKTPRDVPRVIAPVDAAPAEVLPDPVPPPTPVTPLPAVATGPEEELEASFESLADDAPGQRYLPLPLLQTGATLEIPEALEVAAAEITPPECGLSPQLSLWDTVSPPENRMPAAPLPLAKPVAEGVPALDNAAHPAEDLAPLPPTLVPAGPGVNRVIFCPRCRGLEVGWNWKYLAHCLLCRGSVSRSRRAAACTLLGAVCLSVFLSARGGVLYSAGEPDASGPRATRPAGDAGPSVLNSIEDLLKRHTRVTPAGGNRIALAVVDSAQKYGADPFLVASVLLAESGGDPSAVSASGTAGLLQIHLPTWGFLMEQQHLNVLRVEDNVDFGTRVLKEYTDQYGLWNGVLHYLSAGETREKAREKAIEQINRIQRLYSDRSAVPAFGQGIHRVVIDAGHGGLDAGTVGPTGLTEKDLVFDIANRLRVRIESELGAQVVLTRSEDVYVPLEVRTSIANQSEADLFVSIHANSGKSRSIRGFEIYSLNATLSKRKSRRAIPDPPATGLQDMIRKIVVRDKAGESKAFATHIQKAFAASDFGRDRGVKHAPFTVLAGANMPAILAEVSFISNPEDERLLRGDERRRQIAEALFEGVRSYSESVTGLDKTNAGN